MARNKQRMKSYAAQSRANQAKGNQRWSRNANRPVPQGNAFGWHGKERGERVKDMVHSFDRENPNFSGRDFPGRSPDFPLPSGRDYGPANTPPTPTTPVDGYDAPPGIVGNTNLNNSLAEAWKVSGDRWRTKK